MTEKTNYQKVIEAELELAALRRNESIGEDAKRFGANVVRELFEWLHKRYLEQKSAELVSRSQTAIIL